MESDNVVPLQASSRRDTESLKKFHPARDGTGESSKVPADPVIFDNLVWMTSAEAAQYLRKSVGALRTAVCRGQINARKWRRRLYFKRLELDRLLDSSERKGGI